MSTSRKRKRLREEKSVSAEAMINAALKEIYDNNEVNEPTKKKIRNRLQTKLNASKPFIKQNKQLINTLIQQYWLSPPKLCPTNNRDSNSNSNSKESRVIVTILSIPDEIQQYIFTLLHPNEMYISLPSVCKWWNHLLNKPSFLSSLCTNILKMNNTQIPSPLNINNLSRLIKHSCIKCCAYNSWNDLNGGRFAPNKDRTENMYCWEYPICESCYNQHLEYQGIYWMHARRKYKLTDSDLHCCKFKKYGRTYLLHSNVIEIAKNKYGDISCIQHLSSLDIAAINSQRKRCYNKKCKELKKELKAWLKQTYLKQDEQDQDEDKDNDDIDIDVDVETETKIESWQDIELNESELKSELNEFLKKHHSGYEWFDGAHCQPTVDNFNRQYMHLIVEMREIEDKLRDHINGVKQRRFRIKNMSKKEMYNDIYKSSWMDNRFGSGYGDYI